MALLCFIWGFGHVAAKLAAPGISLVMQARALAIAAVFLIGWARFRATPLFNRDGSFWPGLLAGALFAAEFLFIFAGLNYTGASRMVVFIYLAPCLTALGLHIFVPSERLHANQWAGSCWRLPASRSRSGTACRRTVLPWSVIRSESSRPHCGPQPRW